MDVEFDGEKDRSNGDKHGISLARAAEMDVDTALVAPDDRLDYGEPRYVALGMIDGRLHSLVFTMRGETMRAISLRKANAKERKRYDRR